MAIYTVRRLAADIFGVGERRIRIAPESVQEAEGALTRADVKALIEKGIVTKVKSKGRASTRKKGGRGPAHRKGTKLDAKQVWMQKIRAQRKFLVVITKGGALKKQFKRSLYGKIKSGLFKNKRAMLLYLKDNDMVAKDYEPPKAEFKKPVKPAASAPQAKAAEAKAAAPKPAVAPKQEKGERA